MKLLLALALSTAALAVPVVVAPSSGAISTANSDRVVHYANAVPADTTGGPHIGPMPNTEVVNTPSSDNDNDDALAKPKTNIKTPAARPPTKDNSKLHYGPNEMPVPVAEKQ